jgi:hypothetical protein
MGRAWPNRRSRQALRRDMDHTSRASRYTATAGSVQPLDGPSTVDQRLTSVGLKAQCLCRSQQQNGTSQPSFFSALKAVPCGLVERCHSRWARANQRPVKCRRATQKRERPRPSNIFPSTRRKLTVGVVMSVNGAPRPNSPSLCSRHSCRRKEMTFSLPVKRTQVP